MASDNHAHYSRIGFIVVVGVAAIALTLVYMGGFRDPNSEFIGETYSDSPVTGLSVGSPVNLFGVKVGEVREIAFATTIYDTVDSNDLGRVCIVMAINKKRVGNEQITDENIREFVRARARNGLRATVTQNGITGLARVDLKIDETAPKPETPIWTPRYPMIPPMPSLMDNFSVAATKVMNKLKTINLDEAWSNVNQLVISSVHVAESVDALVESQRASIHQILSDISETSSSIRELSATLKDNPSLLLRPADPEPLPETER